MLDSRNMGAHRGPCTQDEPGVELHTKGRTVTDDGDWYSAEKHAWVASAEGRAMDARGPATVSYTHLTLPTNREV